jgi:predicted fused transcriptional regulator/phosphomethylpyrimidine kinase
MANEAGDIEEVEARLKEIRRQKRGRVRWTASRHTAELALDAVLGDDRPRRPSSKGRRRKKRKRLL